MKSWIVFLFSILLFSACKKEDKRLVFEGFQAPSNFPTVVYKIGNNPVTKEGFELGKKIFYDGRLSRDGSISCGDCHISFSAFSHPGHDVSHGIEGKLGTRNSPPIQNMAWQPFFFWDGGVFDLDLFSINPIQNPVEMDETIGNVVNKLKADPAYVAAFKAAFGTEEVTGTRVFMALSQFMCMLISDDSKYDQMLAGEASFTAAENSGLQLFQQKCQSCHSGILFTDHSFKNNGLRTSNDRGRSMITLRAEDDFCFKVPSLRNVEKTAPYMHDGRFETLEQVLNHYDNGVQTTATLDTILQQNGRLGIALSASEKADMIAFLKTLTDEKFIKNPLFAQ